MIETTKITLELPVEVVEKIQQLTECNIKQLLQSELSIQNADAFIEKMNYNNW